MGYHDHHDTCWLSETHPLCRLRKIHELQVQVLTLETQLQHARTGHLVPQESFPVVYAGQVSHHPIYFATPCADVLHDHIEPPIVSNGPTWSARNDEPPSFTP